MNRAEFASCIDHTVLGPETTFEDVERVCDEALDHGMNVCIPPCYVAEAVDYAPNVTTATVIGFPHGQHATGAKEAEAELAWTDGADELDMVANVGRLKAGENDRVREDIAAVVAAVPLPVKVIVEAPLLTDEELNRACRLAEEADAEMVKTATGFSEGGATIEDVRTMANYLPVKASGGIGSAEKALAMLEAGAERIGASSGSELVEGYEEAAAANDADSEAGDGD